MKLARILLVEDSPTDALLTEEALELAGIECELTLVDNGEQALDWLRQCPRSVDLVLLDLNLPRMDGRGVLEAIRSDPDLRSLPVVVMTTSDNDRDVLESYQMGANCYITKAVDFEEFVRAVRGLGDFMMRLVTLPTREVE